MDRRAFLRAGIATTTVGFGVLAGCTGLFDKQYGNSGYGGEPPVPENRPQAVYYPSHVEGMEMAGMSSMNGSSEMQGNSSEDMKQPNNSTGEQNTSDAGDGRYICALTYSYPHRFWTVTGQRTEKVSVREDDSIHLMVSVWDGETGLYMMDTSPTVTISQDGETTRTITTLTPWTMLSQNMGFHAGDNVELPEDGTYIVTVDVPPPSARRLGEFEGQFTAQQSFEFKFEYSQEKRNEIMFERRDQRAGEQGALDPMKMDMMPLAHAPKKTDLPGRVLGETTSGDGVFVVAAIEDASRLGAEGPTYLAVSPRTPYNRYILPSMSLSATIRRDRETVFDDSLPATIEPTLAYHYGAVVEDIESGDEIEIIVDAPPQVARHEGYETAFLDMPSLTMTVQ